MLGVEEARAALAEENPDALWPDGFEAAFIGIARRCAQPPLAAFSVKKCLQIPELSGQQKRIVMKKKSKKPKKSYHLTAKEIATVKSMTKAGATMRQIAKKIGRVPSTVWRWQHA